MYILYIIGEYWKYINTCMEEEKYVTGNTYISSLAAEHDPQAKTTPSDCAQVAAAAETSVTGQHFHI